MAPSTARAGDPHDNIKPLISDAELRKEFAHVDEALTKIESDAAIVPPVFEDDDDLAAAKAMAPTLRGAMKRIEDLRKQTKAPFDTAASLVHAHFKALEKRMADIATKHERAATVYLNKKRADAEAAQRKIEAEERAEAKRLADAAADAAKAGNLSEAVSTQAASQQAADRADDAASMAAARPADLARTATPTGAATLVQNYSFEVVDIEKVNVVALQRHFTRSELEAAIGRFVKAGGRELPGVRIFPDHKARL